MRSMIVMATCALAVFAAPVPEPIYKTGGTGCVRVVAGVCVRTGKREVEAPVTANIEARFPEANVRGKKNSRSFKSDSKRSPSPFGRGSHPRDIEIDPRSPEPFGRGSHPRDVEDDDDIEARAIRNQGGRSKREEEMPVDNIEARAIRNQGGRSKREEETHIDDIEARGAVRNQDKRSDADVEVREAALSRPKGTRREAALSRPKGTRREAALSRPKGTRREAALSRPKGNPRRSPAHKRVPGGVRGSN